MTTITLPRATVEQALEALEDYKYAEARTALRAALEEPQTCVWQQDGDSDSGIYGTSCGHYFDITDGTPKDNEMQWCCYCGKQLEQELTTEDEDE